MPPIPLRNWATPLVIAAFAMMAVTGTLMFFHAAPGLSKVLHEWAGWIFLAGAGAHLALNWRAFTLYLRRPVARAILAGGTLTLALSMLPLQSTNAPDIRMMLNSLSGAELTELAAISGQSDTDLLTGLADKGISATSARQTVAELAGGDAETEMTILQSALAQAAP